MPHRQTLPFFARRAFTIIELLVVVAIIAIIAAIALPNFLEAQARAKVSRARADMRTMALGLDMYFVDWNKYPLCNNNITSSRRPHRDGTIDPGELAILERVSSPVAYLSNAFVEDPFRPTARTQDHSAGYPQGAVVLPIAETNVGVDPINPHYLLKYGAIDPAPDQETGFANTRAERPRGWILYSSGPDRNYPSMGTLMKASQPPSLCSAQIYDPTNGTISYGDIYRVNPGSLSRNGFAGEFMAQVLRAR